MAKKPIVIIGAGIGGITAAIRLRLAGKHVIILEKNAQVGGKMGQLEQDGFRWDMGPSVITMRHVFEDLFNAAGRQLEDYLELVPLEPLTRYFYPDGTVFDASGNLAKMASQIKKLDERDVPGFLKYLAYAAQIHRVTGPVFIYDHPPTLRSFRRVPITDWLKADPFRTMHGAIAHHIRSPYLRQLLGRFATYVGGSPYDAPATLNVIAHVELTGGVWYPKGGIYSIAEALHNLACELSIDIQTNCPAEEVLLENGHVTGVRMKNGGEISTHTVIANVDVTTTYRHLLPKTPQVTKRLKQLEAFEPSCSGFVLMLGVNQRNPELAHHNIFFSHDYRAEFDTIFKHKQPATDPTIYVAITSKTDPSHAPENCENWFILVNVPPVHNELEWPQIQDSYHNLVLNRLRGHGYDIQDKIMSEHILTPIELQNNTGAWRGALYGPSPNNRWTAFKRPHNRVREIPGLYFTGGTTHPGGGIPMVMLSGKVTAEMVIQDNP